MDAAALKTSSRTAPARAERRSAEDRRKQILCEANACFADLGYRGTTTRLLAQRVGISEAALYRYYPSKDSLYTAIIDQKMAAPELLEALRPAAEACDDEAVFRGLAREIFARVDADPNFLRILMFTALEGHALSEPFFASRVRKLREFVTDYVEKRIRDGAFREIDPGLAGRAFLGMVFDHLHVRHIIREKAALEKPLDTVADTFVEIFLGGMRKPQGEGETS